MRAKIEDEGTRKDYLGRTVKVKRITWLDTWPFTYNLARRVINKNDKYSLLRKERLYKCEKILKREERLYMRLYRYMRSLF